MTTIGSLFTGYGGLDMAAEAVTGGHTVWRSDIDPGACKIIAHHWPDDPNLGDISAIDWSAVEPVDVITGGFPCQDVSMAGRRAGMNPGTRSGLWQIMAKAIDALRPTLVVAENVRGLLSADAHSDVEPCPWCVGDPGDEPPLRALGAVLGDLADIGYDAAWHGLTAASVGAPHGRFRVFIVAWPADTGRKHGQRWPTAVSGCIGPGADPASNGWNEGRPEPAGIVRGSDAAQRGNAVADARCDEPERRRGIRNMGGAPTKDSGAGEERQRVRDALGDSGSIDWGQFEPAIRRWERLTRPAPAPTELSAKGNQRLSPKFVEWMMGLPLGHVTDVPGLTRNEQLKALGNGVVIQQAEAAIRYLLSAVRSAA